MKPPLPTVFSTRHFGELFNTLMTPALQRHVEYVEVSTASSTISTQIVVRKENKLGERRQSNFSLPRVTR